MFAFWMGLLAVRGVLSAHLRSNASHVSATAGGGRSFYQSEPQCQCVANNPAWKKTERTEPKCIFIDLGAADGNTFAKFLENDYGPVKNCPSGKWEAFLLEANPQFTKELNSLQENFPGQVHSLAEHAAFSCEGTTSFFIDADATHNHWGSSMMSDAPDAKKSGDVKVTVPMLNVVQLIAENVRPDDWVMLKVDVEGAEYNLIPCLAQFSEAGMVDRMYLEEHWWFPSITEAAKSALAEAKKQLVGKHVDIPNYYSET
ncbi:unnamed protein product [Symbiodinium necroappetens]|nr:unnamed protein product [Symbiodinium microadriaticum]CAE7318204.1 unnamed protein product [Symbiodinium sp. KB8]CAE7514551.1 unnamed protein product [Symbiodinium sp. CCMP2456]CAE7745038.1 unnamed protein product [Symbiodinium necroappetens]